MWTTEVDNFPGFPKGVMAVSYTHLTLPTSDLVQISVVAVSLKKKKQNNMGVDDKEINNTKYTGYT